MAQKIIALAFVQAIIFQMVNSQVIGRFGGGCGCNNLFPITEKIIGGPFLPGQTILSSGQTIIPSGQTILSSGQTILPSGQYLGNKVILDQQPTTIIQDSTVANNLANALQLLVVSNLLSSTLPLEQPAPLLLPGAPLAPVELLAPSLAAPYSCGCGGCGCNQCGLAPYNILY